MFIIKRKSKILTILKDVDCVHFNKMTGEVEFLYRDETLKLKLKSESGEGLEFGLENALIRAFTTNEIFVEV